MRCLYYTDSSRKKGPPAPPPPQQRQKLHHRSSGRSSTTRSSYCVVRKINVAAIYLTPSSFPCSYLPPSLCPSLINITNHRLSLTATHRSLCFLQSTNRAYLPSSLPGKMTHPYASTVKTTDELQISPPTGSVSTTTVRLTFFDVGWLIGRPVQRVFFYSLPNSNSSHFRRTILPNLTSSLSLALSYFYPFAGRLISPPGNGVPYILYSDGDSVPLTVAETSLNFDQVTSDSPNDVALIHPLLPILPDDGTTVSPLLAVKVTLFPDSGVCIGFEFHHVAADGMAFNHFVKSWASICKSGGEGLSMVDKSPPCHDRSLICDPRNLREVCLEQIRNCLVDPTEDESTRDRFSGKVRATFVIGREDISRLKDIVNRDHSDAGGKQPPPASTFAVTSALVWTNLMKSLEDDAGDGNDDGDKTDSYAFMADYRGRLEPKLPATYFGNCIGPTTVSVKRRLLLGDEGFVAAAKAIAAGIHGINGSLGDADTWVTRFGEAVKLGKVVTVAGSPRLRVYETDFGWGRPRKSESVHIDSAGTVYFSDVRDEERGGIEFGLVLGKAEMDAFAVLFEQRLNQLAPVG